MSERIRVCAEADLAEGERTVIDVDGDEIGVINVGGEYFAISNVCAHMGGPVCQGKVQRTLRGEFTQPGQRVTEYFVDEPAIACPWHGWEYALETGEHLGEADIAIPTFDVTVEDGTIFVDVS